MNGFIMDPQNPFGTPENYTNFYVELQQLLDEFGEGMHKEIPSLVNQLKLRSSLIINVNWLESLTLKLEQQSELVDALLDIDVQIRLLSQKYFNDQNFYHKVTRSVIESVFLIQPDGEEEEEQSVSNNYFSTLFSEPPEVFRNFLDRNRYLVTLFILSQ